MKKPKLILITLFHLLLWQAACVCAQNPLVFKNINVDNGLSQNTVLSVLQDKKGYLWVGTFDGLSRFNGLEFKVFKSDVSDKNSISNNKIDKLFLDKDGKIWAATFDGLNLYDPDKESFTRFKTADSKGSYTVLDVAQDKKGIIWVGTADHGLYYYDAKSTDGKANLLTRSNICNDGKITCLYIDNGQKAWVGVSGTLKVYNLVTKTATPLPGKLNTNTQLLNSVIRSIMQDHAGNYWIATETSGLFYYDVKSDQCSNYNQSNGLLSNTIRATLERDNNTIWVGTKKGLNIINTQTKHISTFVNDPINSSSLSQNSIRCIFEDNEHNVWIGTYNGGLNSVYSQYDNFYSLGLKRGNAPGLSYGIVNTIINGTHNDYWIGTDDGGLNHIDDTFKNNRVYYQFNGASRELLGNSIKAICTHDDSNKLWIGTGSGISVFDKRTGTFTTTGLLKDPSPTGGGIQSYVLLRDAGGLWIGTHFSGLYYLENNNKLHHYQTNESNIAAIFKDGDKFWIGLKNKGLDMIDLSGHDADRYHISKKSYNFNNNAVLTIYRDGQNRLWVGTDGSGLNYFDAATNKFYAINETDGVANNTIYSILQDKAGHLWLSTNKGISCLTINNFKVPFDKSEISVANYTVADGLQSNQFSAGASLKTPQGTFIFGGINGITIFNPDKIRINNIKPQVVFTDFSIFNKPVSFNSENSPLQKPIDETNEITLSYSQAYFSIKFAALNYINPDKNQFAFKLEGFSDNDWHYVGNQRIATYTNLDPGIYYFAVKAANNDGVWNEVPRVLKITVLPPWYKTWIAYLGYIALAIILLYLFNEYSRKTERLQNELKFESMSHAKDQELAQKQLNFFVNISHEIKTPLTMIMAPIERMIGMSLGSKAQNQLTLMQRNGERLIRLINQLLDQRKLESGHMQLQAAGGEIVGFCKEIMLAFGGLAKLKNVELKFSTQQPTIEVWFDADKLEKVLYNLLSNAIKFTQNYGKVNLSITQTGENVLLAIEDNGCGIPTESLDKIFTQFYHFESGVKVDGTGLGLAFSKDLISLHHGMLTVNSRPETANEAGHTEFIISLPIGDSHLKASELAGDAKDAEILLGYSQNEQPVRTQLLAKKAEILKKEDRERLSMLIVEDNEDVLNFIKEGFDGDFEVHTAGNGLDGLAVAISMGPDIIISDVMMPVMDGIELCSKLKSTIDTSHIPVILLTARTQLIFKLEGIETGADDYITKPFNFSMLEARVWNLIENRQKLRERYQKEIKLEPQNIAISNLDGAFLMKVMNYVEQHITDPELSVEQLSNAVALSKSSFYKKIKSLTNLTGVEFIRSVRLKRAAQLLAQGQQTVNEVSYAVGFMDVDYFRKCFKEQFGHTPKEHPVSGTTKS